MKRKLYPIVLILFFSSFINAEDSCTTSNCHKEFQSIKVWHEPAQDDCSTCHEETDQKHHKFSLVDLGKDLCYECHDNKELGQFAHGPVSQGDCVECHNPHGSDYPFFLAFDREDKMCRTCHEVDYNQSQYVHGPLGPGKCSTCHNPHSSDHKHLLISPPESICIECHTERYFSGDDLNLHSELKENGCSSCHDPHASDIQFQLLSPPQELCTGCHDDISEKAESSTHKHSILEQKKGCLNCHNPHGSVYENNLNESPLDLCINCHNKPILASNGKDYNIAKVLKANKNPHGPIKDGNCTGCHDPHGSNYFKILKNDFPKEFYTPFDVEKYALCFNCHDKELVLYQQTNTMTNFRDGESNLHYLHVNKEKKGRTCRSCHEVHASNQDKHLRLEVPFGKWSIPINFEELPTGGRCSPGCHKPKTYTR